MAVRADLGFSLRMLQNGQTPNDAKPFNVGIPGGWELRAKDASGQYRVIYVLIVKGEVHVLHCFKKTSAKTAKPDVEKAQQRYKDLRSRIDP